ncbi:hypothetical protein PPYR_10028 [Photinus pyralis]|uniref:AGC-kinase C-terminal domain-containing protein n=1 Tax=Photinus pyralis TaxID=7054 RepID=A0A5N4AF54_PHOPY|nr:hypothetical protein PPYR_10028 [Photinus pyralis]
MCQATNLEGIKYVNIKGAAIAYSIFYSSHVVIYFFLMSTNIFTNNVKKKIELTPTDKLFMMNLDQTEFMGFSFLNPEFIQHV